MQNAFVRFFFIHAVIGYAIAAAIIGGLIVFDIHNIGTLITRSSDGVVMAVCAVVLMGSTFGAAQIAFASLLIAKPIEQQRMNLHADEDDTPVIHLSPAQSQDAKTKPRRNVSAPLVPQVRRKS